MKLHLDQQGTHRAQYGDKLSETLSDRLIQAGVNRAEARELRRYRQFYLTYPQIRESLTPEKNIRHMTGGESGSSEGGH